MSSKSGREMGNWVEITLSSSPEFAEEEAAPEFISEFMEPQRAVKGPDWTETLYKSAPERNL